MFKDFFHKTSKAISEIKSEIIIISVLIILGIVNLRLIVTFDDFKDYGVNFLAEIFGLIITILIINILLKKIDNKKEIPKELVVYEEIKNFLRYFINFWLEMYVLTVPEEEPSNINENIKQFFSMIYMTKIWWNLDLDAKMPSTDLHSSLICWEYLSITSKDLIEKANHILNRYNMYLNPENFLLIYNITNLKFLEDLKNLNHYIMDRNLKEFIPRCLWNNIDEPTNDDYISIIKLIELYDNMFNKIHKYNRNIMKLKISPLEEFNPNYQYKPLMMDEKKKKSQIEEYFAFLKQR